MPALTTLQFDSPIGRWQLDLLAPPLDLAPFVEALWHVHGFANYARERILPRTAVELMFNLGPPHRVVDLADARRTAVHRHAWFSGLQHGPLLVEPCFDAARVPSHLIAARLRPHGAHVLFGASMDELSNRVTELRLVLGSTVDSLQGRLLEAESLPARFDLLIEFLRHRLRAGAGVRPLVRWAAQRIESAHGALRVHDLCRELGVSRKHLGQWFRRQIGIAPKQYAGIARFQHLVGSLVGAPWTQWSERAQSCGYYDQAHLAHECQAFAGMTPVKLLHSLSPDGVAAIE